MLVFYYRNQEEVMAKNDDSAEIRAKGEGDSSQEFKYVRHCLVVSINEYLIKMAGKRDTGEPLADGRIITDEPRLVRSYMGKIAANLHIAAIDRKSGVSVEGDGVATRLRLQMVMLNEDGVGETIIEVTGSDPIERQFNNGEYNSRSGHEAVASFILTDMLPGQPTQSLGYAVMSNGLVWHRFVDDRGAQVSQTLQTVEDIELATAAFSAVQSQLGHVQD